VSILEHRVQAKEKKTLEQFDREIARRHLRGQWKSDEMLVRCVGGPQPAGKPYLWSWSDVYPLLLEACDVLPESFTARRHLSYMNPGLERGGATHTIRMGLQMAQPGETAWAHRHSIAAIRFVVQGSPQAYTVVDGKVCPMENYDLVLTPPWSWHDHHNESAERVVWLDVLDASLIAMLNATFYEPYSEERQEVTAASAGELRPAQGGGRGPLRYSWVETEKQLQRLAGAKRSPYDGVSLEYVNPQTAGPVLPTMSCWIQMLRAGEQTERHRHTSSAVYFVVQGNGETLVGNERIEWNRHDAFAVPNWSWHEHRNRSKTEAAILFSVNDIPVFRALGLYREEPRETVQPAPAPLFPFPAAGR
jgi:1-hydroxy-2-naphthoate dioxygenase